MKQKPKPVALISLLCVLGLVVVGSNMTPFLASVVQALSKKPTAENDGKETSAAKASEDDKAAAKAAVLEKSKVAQPRGEDEAAKKGLAKEPTIFVPKPQVFKPQFNETSTAGQWFKDDHNTSNREAELKAKRGQTSGE